MIALGNQFSNDELFLGYPKPEQAKEIITSVLPQYYSDRKEPVIFDKNRSWTVRMNYIPGYFDIQPKVICPVRDTAEILTSFISMMRRNPYEVNGKINFIDEMLVKNNIPLTDDNRCEFIASPNGILGQSVEGLRKALMEGYDNSIHLVEYLDLVNNPKETVEKIYEFLGEELFEHDFNKLDNINRENDAQIYGFADMHDVRPTLESVSKNPEDILSPEILEKCKDTEFWRIINSDFEDTNEEEVSEISEDDQEDDTQFIGS
jgi:sulfotransferase